jgi:trk system potassium uptake protein TrkA
MLTINRILQFVRRGEVLSVSELSEEKIEAIVYRVTQNSILAAKEISSKNFQEIFPPTAIIGAIQKETTNEVIIPRGSTELAVGDKVMIYSSPEAVKELEKIFV